MHEFKSVVELEADLDDAKKILKKNPLHVKIEQKLTKTKVPSQENEIEHRQLYLNSYSMPLLVHKENKQEITKGIKLKQDSSKHHDFVEEKKLP